MTTCPNEPMARDACDEPPSGRDVFFGVDLPRPNTVHPLGVPILVRGVCAVSGTPATGICVEIDGQPLFEGPLNDAREDVPELFPPAREQRVPFGYHHYLDLPADLAPGPHTLTFQARLRDGRLVPCTTRTFEASSDGGDVFNPFPDGHFYSPVINVAELMKDRDRIWPANPNILGIDFNHRGQEAFLDRFPQYMPGYNAYPLTPPDDAPEYAFQRVNPVFGELDARTLFVVLRSFRPKNMIEIGCGYSSLLVADVNRRFLGGGLNFVCIEPYPRPFLRRPVPGITRLIERRVQDVPLDEFAVLGDGDVLFIDSSHVAKTGSDVNHEFFEIIPRLRPGVLIHVHDIHLPHDYMAERVLGQKQSWTEQYILRAMLMFTDHFEVIFGSSYAHHHLPGRLREVCGGKLYDGVSFWFRKVK